MKLHKQKLYLRKYNLKEEKVTRKQRCKNRKKSFAAVKNNLWDKNVMEISKSKCSGI